MNKEQIKIKYKAAAKNLIIVALIIVVAIILIPKHTKNVIFYQYPDTYDHTTFENTTIETGTPAPWKIAPKNKTHDFPEDGLNYLKNKKTYSFVVAHKGKIVNEYYGNDAHPLFRSNVFSLTHGLLSLMVGCALKDGSIKSLDQKVTDFYPEFSGEHEKAFTIRTLLTMTSGFKPHFQKNARSLLPIKPYYSPDTEKRIISKSLKNIPGEVWAYNGDDSELLSMILKRATGLSAGEYLEKNIWKPIGAETPALWPIDDKGNEKASCFFATARDFTKIGQLVLNRGAWNGKQLISKRYIKEMLSAQKGLVDKNKNPIDFFGMQWWLTSYKKKQVAYLQGCKGQYLIVVPQHNLVIARFGEKGRQTFNGTNPKELFRLLKIAFRVSGIS
jgi:CubicO group peptidase (beta-lactamase class C family)